MTAESFAPKSDFIRVLQERGYIHQASDLAGIDALAAEGGLTTYTGYDCTAASLHLAAAVPNFAWLEVWARSDSDHSNDE